MASKRQKYLHTRDGTWYYIRRVPLAAQSVVGADRWDFSLDTKDEKLAEAAARAKAVEHDQLVHAVKAMPEVERLKVAVRVREQALAHAIMAANVPVKPSVTKHAPSATPGPLRPTPSMRAAIQANNRLVDARTALEQARNAIVPDGGGIAVQLERDMQNIDFVRHRLELLRFVQKGVEKPPLAKGHALVVYSLTSDPDGYAKLFDMFTARQLIEQIRADEEAIEKHERGQRAHKAIAERLGVEKSNRIAADDPANPRILTALDQWIAREKQTHDTARKYRAHIRRLVDSVGNIPMRSLRKGDIIRFVDELETMPNATHLKESERTLPLSKLIQRRNAWLSANPDGHWPLISNASIRKHLESVKAFVGWYASRQDDMANVARDVKAPKDKREKDEYEVREFTPAELTKIMTAAVTLWGADGEMTWLIRAALYTGARLEEICQLARANIVEKEGCFCLTLDRGKFEEDGQLFRRKLKNDASVRVVPLHSALIDGGFLKFAEGTSVRLFPSFKRSAGRYGHNPSKAFHRLLREQLKLDDARVRFHSLRHTLITAMHNKKVHPTVVKAIVGHELAKGTHADYIGGIDVAVMKEAIEHVRFV